MELKILRRYYPNGTNGLLLINQTPCCHSIELPWQQNAPCISCIPEGSYPVFKRHSDQYGWHLHVADVPGRSLILMHPFNHALEESKGCIAPVSELTGQGMGTSSRIAFHRLRTAVYRALDLQEPVFLTIQKDIHEKD
jgi:hypothetical protein